MGIVLFVLALALVLAGGAAVFIGFDILLGDRGLPMVVVGTVIAATGLALLGMAGIARTVRRLERRVVSLANDLATRPPALPQWAPPPVVPPPANVSAADFTEGARADEPIVEAPDLAPQLPLVEPPQPPRRSDLPPLTHEPTIVGRYASGGNAYVMFSDGAIEADTPTGRHRFASLDELRAFVASGGEKGEPS